MNRFCLVVLSFAFLLVGACSETPKPDPNATGKVVFVLFDLSDSTNTEQVRGRYQDGIKRIIEKMGAGDVLVADAITENPLAQSFFPVNETFPTFVPATDNDLLLKKQREEFEKKLSEARSGALGKATSFLSATGRSIKQTHILEAMQLAEQVFGTFQRPKKVLVVFSDMIEESGKYNFAKQKLDESAVKSIIEAERKEKRLPNLTGVKCYIVGASTSSDTKGNSSFMAVEDFWLSYFKAAGADLAKERYGSGFLSFEE